LHSFALASASGGAALLCVIVLQEKDCSWCYVAVGRLLHVCGLEGRYGRGYEEADGAWNDRCGDVVMMSVMAMAMLVVMMIVVMIKLFLLVITMRISGINHALQPSLQRYSVRLTGPL
jgi:hypothetical protein